MYGFTWHGHSISILHPPPTGAKSHLHLTPSMSTDGQGTPPPFSLLDRHTLVQNCNPQLQNGRHTTLPLCESMLCACVPTANPHCFVFYAKFGAFHFFGGVGGGLQGFLLSHASVSRFSPHLFFRSSALPSSTRTSSSTCEPPFRFLSLFILETKRGARTSTPSTQLSVKLCQWVVREANVWTETRIRALFKKKSTKWVLMYSSAAKSRAYVAQATPWSPLCTALNVCMHVCVWGGQERILAGGGG